MAEDDATAGGAKPSPPSPPGPPSGLIAVSVAVLALLVGAGGVIVGRLLPFAPSPAASSAAPAASSASAVSAAPAASSIPPDVNGQQAGDPAESNGIPADQQNNPQWTQCASNDPTTSIAGCSAIITANNESGPDLSVAYNSRGVAYNATGQYTLAIADLNKAIQADPNDTVNPYINLGDSENELNDFKDAMADFNAAIQADPNNSGAYTARATQYTDQQDWTDAIADYTKAIQLLASNGAAYDGRGVALLATGQTSAASADFNTAAQIGANDQIAIGGQGEVAYDQGQYAQAITAFTHAISIDAQDDVALYWRSLAEQKTGDAKDAAADLAAAQKINPSVGPTTMLTE